MAAEPLCAPACAFCSKDAKKECENCGTCYCSEECQRADYVGHEAVCEMIHADDMVAAFFTEKDIRESVPLDESQFKESKHKKPFACLEAIKKAGKAKIYGTLVAKKTTKASWRSRLSSVGPGSRVAATAKQDAGTWIPIILVLADTTYAKKKGSSYDQLYGKGLLEISNCSILSKYEDAARRKAKQRNV